MWRFWCIMTESILAWLSTLANSLILSNIVKTGHLMTWQTTSYPDVECDGLPLFKAQVQFWSWIPELSAFTDFILLFHPSASRQRCTSAQTYRNKQSLSAAFRRKYSMQRSASSSQQTASLFPHLKKPHSHLLTWNGPAEPRWNQKHLPDPRNQLLWTHCDLRTTDDVTVHEPQSSNPPKTDSQSWSWPHRCRPVSVEQSTGWSRWPFPLQRRDTP